MRDVLGDLRAECASLDAFVSGLDDDAWRKPTVFWNWTTWDEIMHLHFVDEFGWLSLTDPPAFRARVAEMRAGQARGEEMSQQTRVRFAGFDRAKALEAWRDLAFRLCDALRSGDPKQRMPWFGPDMSLLSFASARQMEVWAHGQDIFDLFRVRRSNSDSIQNICQLGVRTFAWSFINRQLEAPAAAPSVRLTAPSGVVWEWPGDTSSSVEGPAEDFALVVTQRRHVDDTALRVEGATARRWMEIAQCFAGEAADGPAPGTRKID